MKCVSEKTRNGEQAWENTCESIEKAEKTFSLPIYANIFVENANAILEVEIKSYKDIFYSNPELATLFLETMENLMRLKRLMLELIQKTGGRLTEEEFRTHKNTSAPQIPFLASRILDVLENSEETPESPHFLGNRNQLESKIKYLVEKINELLGALTTNSWNNRDKEIKSGQAFIPKARISSSCNYLNRTHVQDILDALLDSLTDLCVDISEIKKLSKDPLGEKKLLELKERKIQ